jgi:hypothetical protein
MMRMGLKRLHVDSYTCPMQPDNYLTLGEAATISGRSKRNMRDLVRSGRMPAIRRDGRWHIHRTDLIDSRLPPGAGAPELRDKPSQAVPAGGQFEAREEFLALIRMVREKDEQLTKMQDERIRLAGQVGYLQAQLAERDIRLRLLEAAAIESTTSPNLAKLLGVGIDEPARRAMTESEASSRLDGAVAAQADPAQAEPATTTAAPQLEPSADRPEYFPALQTPEKTPSTLAPGVNSSAASPNVAAASRERDMDARPAIDRPPKTREAGESSRLLPIVQQQVVAAQRQVAERIAGLRRRLRRPD